MWSGIKIETMTVAEVKNFLGFYRGLRTTSAATSIRGVMAMLIVGVTASTGTRTDTRAISENGR